MTAKGVGLTLLRKLLELPRHKLPDVGHVVDSFMGSHYSFRGIVVPRNIFVLEECEKLIASIFQPPLSGRLHQGIFVGDVLPISFQRTAHVTVERETLFIILASFFLFACSAEEPCHLFVEFLSLVACVFSFGNLICMP